MKSILSKNELSIHEYHTLRKELKKYQIVYNFLDKDSPSPKMKQLDKLVFKVGELNNLYVDIPYRFNIDLTEHKVQFTDKMKKKLFKSVKAVNSDIKSIRFNNCRGLSGVLQQLNTP